MSTNARRSNTRPTMRHRPRSFGSTSGMPRVSSDLGGSPTICSKALPLDRLFRVSVGSASSMVFPTAANLQYEVFQCAPIRGPNAQRFAGKRRAESTLAELDDAVRRVCFTGGLGGIVSTIECPAHWSVLSSHWHLWVEEAYGGSEQCYSDLQTEP